MPAKPITTTIVPITALLIILGTNVMASDVAATEEATIKQKNKEGSGQDQVATDKTVSPSERISDEKVTRDHQPLNTPEEMILQQVRIAIANYDDRFLQQSIEKLKQIAPDNLEGLKAKVYLNVRQRNFSEAQDTLNYLNQIGGTTKLYQEAKLIYELAQPENSTALQEARLLATAGQLDKAKDAYDKLLHGMLPTLDLEVEYLQLLNRLPDVNIVPRLTELEYQYPGNPAVRLTLARLLLGENNTKEAFPLLEEMVGNRVTREGAAKLWQTYLKTLRVTPESLKDWQFFTNVYKDEPIYTEAQQEIQHQKTLLDDPNYQAKLLGLERINAGEGERAIGVLKTALAAMPDDPELLGALGVAYVRTNQRAEALKLFKRGQELDKTGISGNKWERLISSTEYWMQLKDGDNYLQSHQFAKAIKAYQAAYALDDTVPEALVGLGAIAFEQNQITQAQTYFQKALTLDPVNSGAISGLVTVYERESPQKALNFLKRISKDAKGDLRTQVHNLLGNILKNEADMLISQGAYQKAIPKMRDALAYTPEDPWLRYKLAKLYQTAGEVALADKVFSSVAQGQKKNTAFVQAYVLYFSSSNRPKEALLFLNSLPKNSFGALRAEMTKLQGNILNNEADELISQGAYEEAMVKLHQALKYIPSDPWVRYKLAKLYQNAGDFELADELFLSVIESQSNNSDFIYTYALYLSSSDRPGIALQLLKNLPQRLVNQDIDDLTMRLEREQSLTYANELRNAGDEAAAIAYLRAQPRHIDIELRIASWALLRQDAKSGYRLYREIRAQAPDNQEAQLGEIEALVGLKHVDEARRQLREFSPASDASLGIERQYANLWSAVGDHAKAQALFDLLKHKAAASVETDDARALVYRDAARNEERVLEPQQALADYREAMRYGKMIPKIVMPLSRDPSGNQNASDYDMTLSNETFTYITRLQPEDDWLRRSIRRDAARLYNQQMPTVTLEHDYWGSSGTDGMSDLKANTTMLHIEFPWRDGKVFFRTDYVQLNGGKFRPDYTVETEETGLVGRYYESFGTCALGCVTGMKQRQQGTSVAVGWDNERWHIDIGTTPLEFEVSDWVGGIAYSSQFKKLGYTLTASRRPLSNSLLSFAGVVDPGTGIRFGGARATGINLSLSYDQGWNHGVWASIDAHRITGRNIEDNSRVRLMGGYYYKLINEDHRNMSIGINSMAWHYQKDASGYTLGQGGYYSPQKYFSVSLPMSYRQRTANWSVALDASVSWSHSSTKDSRRYPININWPEDTVGYCARFSQCHVTEGRYSDFLSDRIREGDTGGGFGYTLGAVVERRIDSNWRLGAGIDIRKSKDYTPSRAFVYLRYSLLPWQGDLDMAPKPLVPYAEFK